MDDSSSSSHDDGQIRVAFGLPDMNSNSKETEFPIYIETVWIGMEYRRDRP